MRILHGKHQREMSKEALIALARNFAALELDVGTGDGRFVLDRAKANPEHLIVGLDPVAEAMSAAANRITRRRSRLDNALFVVASVEQMPVELSGLVQEVFINLPWGSLMRGLILGDETILRPLAAVGKPGATYRILLNLRIFSNPIPTEIQDLPGATVDYALMELIEPYAAAGLEITDVRQLPGDDVAVLKTTWARRLSHQHPPPTLQIIARRS